MRLVQAVDAGQARCQDLLAEVPRGEAPGGPARGGKEEETLMSSQDRVRAIVEEQAEDEALWADAKYASKAYLQSALRRLHYEIERPDGNFPTYSDLAARLEMGRAFVEGLRNREFITNSLDEYRQLVWALEELEGMLTYEPLL